MPKTRRPTAHKVMTQLAQLGTAAPQVVAHRVARMAAAGPVLSARDRKEFTGMVLEKQVAAVQSMQNMWLAGATAQRDLLLALSRSLLQPAWFKPAAHAQMAKRAGQAGLSIVSQGLKPLERKASANARRLNRGRKTK